VHYPLVAVTSGKPPVVLTCSPPDGSSFPVGTTTVTCTAVDATRQSSSCSFSIAVTTPPLVGVTHFGAFGDSVTWGEDGTIAAASNVRAYAIHEEIQVPLAQTYPGALQGLLVARYTRQTPTVDNLGHPGEFASDPGTLTRFSTVVVKGGYGAVLVMEGSNDVDAMVKDLAIESKAISNLRQMIQTAKANGVRPYLGTIPPMNPAGSRGAGASLVPEFNNRLASVATSEGVPLVDIFQALMGDIPTNIGPDGLHPTVAGYAKIAATFFDAIKHTLETQPTSAAASQFRLRQR
jgi:lysophospholipase L1-like esterase